MFSSKNYAAEFQRIRDTHIALDLSGDHHESYNARFSLDELHNTLSSTEVTSPEDSVLYVMLRQLSDEAKLYLLKIINRIWKAGVLLKGWKIAIILAIQKPNKDPHTTSYRPIALTRCVCKLMEKMVNSRLVWHLAAHNLLSPVGKIDLAWTPY